MDSICPVFHSSCLLLSCFPLSTAHFVPRALQLIWFDILHSCSVHSPALSLPPLAITHSITFTYSSAKRLISTPALIHLTSFLSRFHLFLRTRPILPVLPDALSRFVGLNPFLTYLIYYYPNSCIILTRLSFSVSLNSLFLSSVLPCHESYVQTRLKSPHELAFILRMLFQSCLNSNIPLHVIVSHALITNLLW